MDDPPPYCAPEKPTIVETRRTAYLVVNGVLVLPATTPSTLLCRLCSKLKPNGVAWPNSERNNSQSRQNLVQERLEDGSSAFDANTWIRSTSSDQSRWRSPWADVHLASYSR